MKRKDDILRLREEGKSYGQIQEILGCSRSTISFHCGQGQKEKSYTRNKNNLAKSHPFKRKLSNFKFKKHKPKEKHERHSDSSVLRSKISDFRKRNTMASENFGLEEVVTKFGDNPVCYLTGEPIDISKPRTYHFDHIIPVSRGGDNSLENLGIASKRANRAKDSMTPDEFIHLCKQVLEHNGYQTSKK